MRPLHSQNGDYDLTSQQTVLTHTPDASHWTRCQGLILLGDGDKPLDGTGGDFEVTVTITLDPEEGGLEYTIQPDPQTIAYSTAVTSGIFTVDFPVPAGAAVTFKLKSPNVADTDVDVTVYLIDTAPLQPTTKGRTGDVSATGEMGLDFNNIKDAAEAHTLTNITVPTVTTNSDMRGTDNAALAETTATSTDVAEMQSHGDDNWATATGFALASIWTAAKAEALTDLLDGGRLDALIDAILEDTGTSLPETLATIRAKTDNLPPSPAAVGSEMGLADNAITAATFAENAIAAAVVAAAAANKLADHIRRRKQENVEASSDGDALSLSSQYGGIQQMQNANTTDAADKLTVKKTDGTALGTLDTTDSSGAAPITGVS